jgi:sulfatase maturation enzyme AslB (radical SAM superfamily)
VKPFNSFISFTGGEPTLYWKKLLQVFKKMSSMEMMTDVPILIQTNGVSIGMGTTNLHDLNGPSFNKVKILFELLIKGTNSEEFELLTRTSKKLYSYQLMAYKMLKNIQNHNSNISFLTVLGNYHSSVKNKLSKYAFVYPSDQKLMFDGYRPWNKKFEKIWNENEKKWVEPLRKYPRGQWENILQRCGPQGAGLIKYFPKGVITNPHSVFSAKPNGYDYAKSIVNKTYW